MNILQDFMIQWKQDYINFTCDLFSPRWQRKGSEKTLNPNGCCMKSMSSLAQDDLMGSLNTCWSLRKDISLGQQNTSVDFVNDDIILAFKQVLRLSLYGQN